MSVDTGRWVGGITPDMAIAGPTDARVLLSLRCAKRAFLPLLWLGSMAATIWILVISDLGPDELQAELDRVSGEGNLLSAILSPMAGVAFALLWRIGVAFAALVVAYPLTRGSSLADYEGVSKPGAIRRMWWDRWYWMRAYRALRWTWAVRTAALERAGASARWFDLAEKLLRVLGYALFVAWILLMMIIL